jgi:acetyl esterase/lipase
MNPVWQLRGIRQWALTLLGFAFAFVLAIALFYMTHPVDFDSIGVLGLYAFLIPSQLLIICLVTALVAAILWRSQWRWPSVAFAAIALLASAMSVWPTLSMYAMAHQHNVTVSLTDSLIPNIVLGGIEHDKSVRYASVNGTDLMLDVWPASATASSTKKAPRPVIVRVHGGGWIAGTRSELSAWNTWLNDLGYVVFDVEYRLAPPARWLDEVGDVKCALGWVAAHAEQYGIDVNRISVLGYSAGGHLAMLAAYTMGDPNLPPTCDALPVKINAVVNLYGPSDLPHGYYNSGSLRYVQHAMSTYIGGTPEAYSDRYRILSPIEHVNAKTPPTITLLGTSDRIVTVDQVQVLDTTLNAAAVPHESYLLPACDHGFDANWSGLSAQFARAKVEAFLRRYN